LIKVIFNSVYNFLKQKNPWKNLQPRNSLNEIGYQKLKMLYAITNYDLQTESIS